MSSFENRSSDYRASAGSAEETLRLLAKLPPPHGLTERVHANLLKAPRTARVLRWPAAVTGHGWRHSSALRGAAAAAIVCIVAGGGWTISARMQPAMVPAAKVVPMPVRTGNSGGFSSANAMRTPQTLNRPVLTHFPAAQPDDDPKPAVQPALSLSGKARSSSKAKKTAVPQASPAVR